jgi:hypothetical protein
VWLIAAECHELIDAIPTLVADPNKDGDIIKTESIHDDIADCARYGLKSMLRPRGTPKSVQLEEKFQGVRRSFAKPTEAASGTDFWTRFGGKKVE